VQGSWLFSALVWLSVAIAALSLMQIVMKLALVAKRRAPVPPAGPLPSVCVLVPAYNEAAVIAATVAAILRTDYPGLEVCVIDDGSRDGTLGIVRAAFGGDARVRIATQRNGGKASALALGMRMTRAEIAVVIDADTVLTEDAIHLMARHFTDPSVGAVSGNVHVGNAASLLGRWQKLEYICQHHLERLAGDAVNGISVVPGAVGAWRRSAVSAAGGFTGDTLAEDCDLTLKVLRAGYRVRYEAAADAFTEAPETVRGFLKQRFRWMFGTMQVFFKHRRALGSTQAPGLGFYALPNVLFSQIFLMVLRPLVDLAALAIVVPWTGLLLTGVVEAGLGLTPWAAFLASLDQVYGIQIYIALLAASVIGAVTAMALARRRAWALLAWMPVQSFVFLLLLSYVGLKCLAVWLRGRQVGWDKLERSGAVAETAPPV
jgi:cellulose synthase/poly-beta-1,6-N-acetylglucosamine synthase-like glycosyltransferase